MTHFWCHHDHFSGHHAFSFCISHNPTSTLYRNTAQNVHAACPAKLRKLVEERATAKKMLFEILQKRAKLLQNSAEIGSRVQVCVNVNN